MSEFPAGGYDIKPPLIGIDLVDPEVLADRLESNPELGDTLFRPRETAYAQSQRCPIQHLAARFAAKEAVVKALGVHGWDPLEVEVVEGGEDVSLRLHGDMKKRAVELGVEVTISMTHVDSLAGAVAMGMRQREDERGA
jgi:holo-[acyl-carrier protein] synthase